MKDPIKSSPNDALDFESFNDLDSRLIREYHRQRELFQMAQKAGLDNAMIPSLAVMNAIVKVLGYTPNNTKQPQIQIHGT